MLSGMSFGAKVDCRSGRILRFGPTEGELPVLVAKFVVDFVSYVQGALRRFCYHLVDRFKLEGPSF